MSAAEYQLSCKLSQSQGRKGIYRKLGKTCRQETSFNVPIIGSQVMNLSNDDSAAQKTVVENGLNSAAGYS